MKLNQGPKVAPGTGSFGIPPRIAEAGQKAREDAQAREKTEAAAETPPEEKIVFDQPEETVTDNSAKEFDPINVLKDLGMEFKEETFQKLIFQGCVDHTMKILSIPVKFKTLTVEEYDMVDETLADELNNKPMTKDGSDNRRSLITLSFAVQEINKKPISKPVMAGQGKDKEVDLMATSKERRIVLSKMSPVFVNQLIKNHTSFTLAFNYIATNPEKYLKNS